MPTPSYEKSYSIKQPNEQLFQARVELDAFEYINLMKNSSPQSLTLDANGNVIINAVEGKKVLENAFKFLNLNSPDEKIKYLLELKNKVEEFLKNAHVN